MTTTEATVTGPFGSLHLPVPRPSGKAIALGGGADAAAWFWGHVDVPADRNPSVCWRWLGPGHTEKTGHVRIWWPGPISGPKKIFVHRAAWFLSGADLYEGEIIRHKCGVADCCNPYGCLISGSSLENAQDRDLIHLTRTPYLPRGEAHWRSKLRDADAARIRPARRAGVSVGDLVITFQLSRTQVYELLAGRTYPDAQIEGPS
jgi:hypothetical protein